jgi:uncharacterized protein
MLSKMKQEKTAGTTVGRLPSRKSDGARPSRSPKKSAQTKADGVLARIQKPRFLPFLTIWFVAAAVLAGLVYWGGSSKPVTPKADTRSSATYLPTPDRTPRQRKPATVAERPPQAPPSQDNTNRPPAAPVKADAPPRPPAVNEGTHQQTNEKLSLALSSPAYNGPTHAPPAPSPPSPAIPPPIAKVAIVIDDFGLDMHAAQRFLSIPFPITISILPHLRHSREIAELAYSQDHEVILHVPMEPKGFPKTNPGPGALLLSMSDDQIQKAVETALDSCPHLSGINNHMGSMFTEHAASMRVVLKELDRRGLYFLDSRTSPKSAGFSTARELHVPSIRRDIFLDHTDSEAFVRSQLAQLIKKARIQGSAIAIGHPHESTWKILSQSADLFLKEGIAVVPAGQLLAYDNPDAG